MRSDTDEAVKESRKKVGLSDRLPSRASQSCHVVYNYLMLELSALNLFKRDSLKIMPTINGLPIPKEQDSRDPSCSFAYGSIHTWKQQGVGYLSERDSLMAFPGELGEQVCYGSLCSIKIRLLKEKTIEVLSASSSRLNIGNSSYLNLRLIFTEKGCNIYAGETQRIGTIDVQSSRALHHLKKTFPVEFCGLLSLTNESDQKTRLSDSHIYWHTDIDVNVYGSHDKSDQIAMELARGGFFLQDPIWKPDSLPYRNPQYLELPGYTNVAQIDEGTGSQGGENAEITQMAELDGLQLDPLHIDFSHIIDRLACHDYLDQAIADQRIKSELLNHQREGLDFIIRRETMSTPSDRSLWQRVDSATDEEIFQHVITGAKSATPVETKGGILADDMGVGKSLTMLSAILGSLPQSINYACQVTSVSVADSSFVIAAKSTLLVVPSALLMDNWIDEVNKHVYPGALTCYQYHGQKRYVQQLDLLRHDIILTTYGTVAAEFKLKDSPLYSVTWYRIVLDEAHMIRNPKTKTFKAITSLKGSIRWCLTGTPIQNNIEDLGSLIKFLKVPIMRHPKLFRRHITSKLSAKNLESSDFDDLRTLLRSICLRRNNEVLHLSRSKDYHHELEFSLSEREEYTRLNLTCKDAVDAAVSGHNSKAGHHAILEGILRLRLFCNNGTAFMAPPVDDLARSEEIGSILQQIDQTSCHYCACDTFNFGNLLEPGPGNITSCQPLVCEDCAATYVQEYSQPAICTICEGDHHMPANDCLPHAGKEPSSTNKPYSTKLLALCNEIQHNRQEGKSIIFSFWKKSLDLASSLLTSQNIAHLRVDGSLTLKKRKEVLTRFKMEEDIRVLLMTFGIGAVGLNNLSVADSVHILEPQWNPSVEGQAIGRLLRLGQERRVHVHRYIMANTLENSVQKRQIQKLKLARGSFLGEGTEQFKQAQLLKVRVVIIY